MLFRSKPSGGTLEGLDETRWLNNWAVKPFGYIRMLKAFLPVLRTHERAAVVNIVGSIGKAPSYKGIYSAMSCSALTTFTLGMAHELAADNIRIVGINSFVVNTEENVAAFSARETHRVQMDDLGRADAPVVPQEEYERIRAAA